MISCDFCSVTTPAVKEYRCQDFVVSAILVKENEPVKLTNFTGNWWACKQCAELIDTNKRTELAERAFEAILDAHRLVITDKTRRKHILASVLVAHDGFFENRIKE